MYMDNRTPTRIHGQRLSRGKPYLALALAALFTACAGTPPPDRQSAPVVLTPSLQVQSVGWSRQRIHALAVALPRLQQQFAVESVAVSLVSLDGEDWAAHFDPAGAVTAPRRALYPADGLAMPLLAFLVVAASESADWTLRSPLGQLAPGESSIRPYADTRLLDVLTTPHAESDTRARLALGTALETATGSTLRALLATHLPTMTESQLAFRVGDLRLTTTAEEFGSYLHALIAAGPKHPATAALLAAHGTVDARRGLYHGLGWSLERQPEGGVIAYQWSHAAGHHHFALLDPRRRRGLVMLTRGQQGRSLIEAALPLIDETPHALLDARANAP